MKNKIIRIYFWIGVNVIGIPELFIHEKKSFVEKSRFFGNKNRIVVNQFKQVQ